MEAIEIRNIEKLIADVNLIDLHQQEIKRLKGESFNIFSILRMESQENATHSAFLGELLNPSGSHLFEESFLSHFLQVINYKGDLITSDARMVLEKHIGTVDLNNKTGGRIDIYIDDLQGNSISIENKLYAGDQEAQIERYVNHNNVKNKVYYLTLNGNMPSENSVGTLEEGVHYYCISYQHTVIKWLTLCMKDAADQPMLRESIKQYILLIKKLTNQLTDHIMENEVIESITKHYQAARIIADNLWKAELEITRVFLNEVKEKLETVLVDGGSVEIDGDLNNKYTGLIVKLNECDGIEVKLEGYPRMPWNDSIYGIRAPKSEWDRAEIRNKLSEVEWLKSAFSENDHWPYYKPLLRFSQTSERARLFDISERKTLVEETYSNIIELIELCRINLSKIKRMNLE